MHARATRTRCARGVLHESEELLLAHLNLGTLKSGAFLIAGNADADMVPCRIIYDTPDHRMHLFCRMRICFGTPIPAAEMKVEDPRRSVPRLRALRSRLKEELERLYEQNKFQ